MFDWRSGSIKTGEIKMNLKKKEERLGSPANTPDGIDDIMLFLRSQKGRKWDWKVGIMLNVGNEGK